MPLFALKEVAAIKRPNSLCKNFNCRKSFYACGYCTHKLAWRAVACSLECYEQYANQVTEARANNKRINLLPERTDMTSDEVQALISTPTEQVIEATKEELKDYADDLNALGLGGTIDKINEEIREADGVIVEQVEHISTKPQEKQGRKKGRPESEVKTEN